MIKEKFSNRLKLLRNDKGMTMNELAVNLGVTKQAVHAWENMKAVPTFDKLIGLSQIFAVSIDFLTGKTDEYGSVFELREDVPITADLTAKLLACGFVEEKTDHQKTFSERFAEQRREKKCGLYEVANAVGIALDELDALEKGEREPNFGELIKIATYFKVSLDFLVGRTEEYPTMMRYEDDDGNFVLIKIDNKGSDGLIFSGKVEPKLYSYNTGDIRKDYEKAIKIASFIKAVAKTLWTSVDFSNNDIRDAIYKYEATVSPDNGVNWFDRFMG